MLLWIRIGSLEIEVDVNACVRGVVCVCARVHMHIQICSPLLCPLRRPGRSATQQS